MPPFNRRDGRAGAVPIAETLTGTSGESRKGIPRRDVDAPTADAVVHGGWLAPAGHDGPVGIFGPDGSLASFEDRDGAARPLVPTVTSNGGRWLRLHRIQVKRATR